jgi:hypothetical protein
MIPEGRRQYLIAHAIVFAIEAMSRLPDEYRPRSDIEDLKEIMKEVEQQHLALLQGNAKRRVDALVGSL